MGVISSKDRLNAITLICLVSNRSKHELSSFRIGRNQQINLDVRLEKVLREAGSSERSSILGSPGNQGTIG